MRTTIQSSWETPLWRWNQKVTDTPPHWVKWQSFHGTQKKVVHHLWQEIYPYVCIFDGDCHIGSHVTHWNAKIGHWWLQLVTPPRSNHCCPHNWRSEFNIDCSHALYRLNTHFKHINFNTVFCVFQWTRHLFSYLHCTWLIYLSISVTQRVSWTATSYIMLLPCIVQILLHISHQIFKNVECAQYWLRFE